MEELEWTPDLMLEVGLSETDDFLKVRETLSRMGVASRREKTLWQSAHILHKKGRYYIAHFKELFALDGKDTNLSENDIARRNTIGKLLGDWGLVNVKGTLEPIAPNPTTPNVDPDNSLPLNFFLFSSRKGSSSFIS